MGLADALKVRLEREQTENELAQIAQKEIRLKLPAFLSDLFDSAIGKTHVVDALADAHKSGCSKLFISTRFEKGLLKGLFSSAGREFGQIGHTEIMDALKSHQLGIEIEKSGLNIYWAHHNNKLFGSIEINLEKK